MDAWCKVGPTSNLNSKRKREEKIRFCFLPILGNYGSGCERGVKSSSFSLLSTEIRWSESVEPRFKVHLLDEGYAWESTTRSFTEDFGFGEEKLMRETLPSPRFTAIGGSVSVGPRLKVRVLVKGNAWTSKS